MLKLQRCVVLIVVAAIVALAAQSARAQEEAAIPPATAPTADRMLELEARIAKLEQLVGALRAAPAPVESRVPPATTLDEAIRIFNHQAQSDQVGKDQPPLTTDEVVGAIRWFNREEAPVTDAEFAAFRQIADTQKLPPGTEFEVLTGFIPGDGFRYTRWSVRIRMPRTAKPGWTFAYSIRERTIRTEAVDGGPESNPFP